MSLPVGALFVLDAGRGKGWFSRELARFGHQVDGIDRSEVAIEQCRSRRRPRRGTTWGGSAPRPAYQVGSTFMEGTRKRSRAIVSVPVALVRVWRHRGNRRSGPTG